MVVGDRAIVTGWVFIKGHCDFYLRFNFVCFATLKGTSKPTKYTNKLNDLIMIDERIKEYFFKKIRIQRTN